MPYSSGRFDNVFASFVTQFAPNVIYDIGVGAGRMGQICKKARPDARLVGFEVWAPYLEQFKSQHAVYDEIHTADFRDWIRKNSNWRADLIVFGDVIEHFFYSEILDCLHFCQCRSKHVVIVWPTEYPQDDWGGNVEESHRTNLQLKDLTDFDVVFYQKVPIEKGASLHFAAIKGIC